MEPLSEGTLAVDAAHLDRAVALAVDSVANAIAATLRHPGANRLVVDCGTATTFDVVEVDQDSGFINFTDPATGKALMFATGSSRAPPRRTGGCAPFARWPRPAIDCLTQRCRSISSSEYDEAAPPWW